MKLSELKLADIVYVKDDPAMGTMAVKNVTDKEVTFFRPYAHTADFECTNGVICYVGVETFSVPLAYDKGMEYELVSRKRVR